MKSAVKAYLRIPLAGMGCFDDWLLPTVFLNLNSEIERALFHSKELNWKWLKPI